MKASGVSRRSRSPRALICEILSASLCHTFHSPRFCEAAVETHVDRRQPGEEMKTCEVTGVSMTVLHGRHARGGQWVRLGVSSRSLGHYRPY